MRSDAKTFEEYLDSLPNERRQAIEQVREVISRNLPEGYEEAMDWGMIAYRVPLETHTNTYNKRPLMYAALASHKNHMAVYLTSDWSAPGETDRFREAYLATGKKLDMGKSCVRFTHLDDLPSTSLERPSLHRGRRLHRRRRSGPLKR
ncbi:MAG TPA: DUF1801 domain-containing protein [Acidimicrobiia bacterium]|jgi:uncharacterized protein YdhG (YjbR/CyaY superfamily)|nr:DUF1801 domain-containing protein [Acidimicrobiia bacterium]